jgi:hypothetical protein
MFQAISEARPLAIVQAKRRRLLFSTTLQPIDLNIAHLSLEIDYAAL